VLDGSAPSGNLFNVGRGQPLVDFNNNVGKDGESVSEEGAHEKS